MISNGTHIWFLKCNFSQKSQQFFHKFTNNLLSNDKNNFSNTMKKIYDAGCVRKTYFLQLKTNTENKVTLYTIADQKQIKHSSSVVTQNEWHTPCGVQLLRFQCSVRLVSIVSTFDISLWQFVMWHHLHGGGLVWKWDGNRHCTVVFRWDNVIKLRITLPTAPQSFNAL